MFVVEHLTGNLRVPSDVSFFWQASSSASVGGSRMAKMHIWMLSDVALDGAQRKALYTKAGADHAIGSNVHTQYTAAPQFVGMDELLPVRSGVVKRDSDYVPVSYDGRAYRTLNIIYEYTRLTQMPPGIRYAGAGA